MDDANDDYLGDSIENLMGVGDHVDRSGGTRPMGSRKMNWPRVAREKLAAKPKSISPPFDAGRRELSPEERHRMRLLAHTTRTERRATFNTSIALPAQRNSELIDLATLIDDIIADPALAAVVEEARTTDKRMKKKAQRSQ